MNEERAGGGRDEGNEDARAIHERADREEERREREDPEAETTKYLGRRGAATLRVREDGEHARINGIRRKQAAELWTEERGGARYRDDK